MVVPTLLCAAWILAAPPSDYQRAQTKLQAIQQGRAPKGSSVVFTQREILAWARIEVPKQVPQGIRNIEVELANGSGRGSALMDFMKMQHAQGKDSNWFLKKLLEGERPVSAWIRVRSGGGKATVFLDRLEISGVAASGTVLDLLLKTFFLSLYPDAKIGTPFELDYNIDRIEMQPSGVKVTMMR